MRNIFALIGAAIVVALMALAIPQATFAADSPDGLKCPMTTLDGKWLDLSDFPGAVNGDCVPLSLASNSTNSTPACPAVIPGDYTKTCEESATGDSVQYVGGVEVWRS